MKSKILGLLAAGLLAVSISAQAYTDHTYDVSGILSNNGAGDPINVVDTLNIGANGRVIGIGWDVTLFADSPSWLEEMVVRFGSSSAWLFDLVPGAGDNIAGTATYNSGGVMDLVGLSSDFSVGADGLLRMEFFEFFDDYLDDWDGIWESGALTIRVEGESVPEPGSLALLGLALAGLGLSRRRKTA